MSTLWRPATGEFPRTDWNDVLATQSLFDVDNEVIRKQVQAAARRCGISIKTARNTAKGTYGFRVEVISRGNGK